MKRKRLFILRPASVPGEPDRMAVCDGMVDDAGAETDDPARAAAVIPTYSFNKMVASPHVLVAGDELSVIYIR